VIHFRSKNDIIQWLERYCPRKAIVRSLLQNGAELLGGFNPVPPTTRPGWIVRVTSRHGRKWIVAIIPCEGTPDYEIRILKKVPWGNWIGNYYSENLMSGDRPQLYAALKERANDPSVNH
jgi:hypothetical protein